jgi:hypothetical protein
MLYLCLISYDPNVKPLDGEPATLQPQHAAVERKMRDAGVYVSGAALMPPELAPVARIQGGRRVPTDGAFAETKELVGGYYLLDCKDADEVVTYAAMIPVDSRSWVDVRQIALFHPNVARLAAMRDAASDGS